MFSLVGGDPVPLARPLILAQRADGIKPNQVKGERLKVTGLRTSDYGVHSWNALAVALSAGSNPFNHSLKSCPR